MPRSYTCLVSKSLRSFLFSVVANVGLLPGKRQRYLTVASGTREACRADTLALIEILPYIANHAPPEVERGFAEGRCRGGSKRLSIPNTLQPAFVVPNGANWGSTRNYRPSYRGIITRLASSPF